MQKSEKVTLVGAYNSEKLTLVGVDKSKKVTQVNVASQFTCAHPTHCKPARTARVLFYTYRVARDTALSSIYCFWPNILLDTAQMKLILPKILLDSKNRKYKKGFKSVLQPYSHGLPPCQTYFLMLCAFIKFCSH